MDNYHKSNIASINHSPKRVVYYFFLGDIGPRVRHRTPCGVRTIPRSTGTGTDPFPSSRFQKIRLPFRSRTCLLFLLRFPFRLRPINSKRTRFPFRPSRTRTSFPVPVPGGMETVYTVTQRLWKTCKIDEYIIRLLDLVAYLT